MKNLVKLSLIIAVSLRLAVIATAATSTGLVTSCTTLVGPPPVGQVPPTPSATSFSNITSNSITASWTPGPQTPSNSVATVFICQMSISNQSNFVELSSNATTEAVATNLPAATTCYFRVIAWDGQP